MFSGINYVYEVYRTQSFSKAAKNLYISQPSLSAMIKKIEAKVGAPLFDRSTNPIQLTEYGEQYIRIAEKIMDLEDEFAYYTDNLNELKTGHLSIGTTSFFASYILPKYISQFSAAYPHVKVNLYEADSQTLAQKASVNEVDMVIDNFHTSDDIYCHRVLMKEYLLLAVPGFLPVQPAGHPLSADLGGRKPGYAPESFFPGGPAGEVRRRTLRDPAAAQRYPQAHGKYLPERRRKAEYHPEAGSAADHLSPDGKWHGRFLCQRYRGEEIIAKPEYYLL